MPPVDPYQPPTAPLDVPVGGAGASGGEVPASVVAVLAETRPWVKFLSVLFFIGMGLGLVAAIVAVTMIPSSGMNSVALIPAFLLMLFYIPPALFLSRYAGNIRRLQTGGGVPALQEALSSQKSFWKYVGVLAIVVMGLYLVLGVFGAIGTLLVRH
jgi:hypothetical protein